MAKEYTTKDGRKIVGWYRRGGKAIPILEGQERKDASQPKSAIKKGEGHAVGRKNIPKWDKGEVAIDDYTGDADHWFNGSSRTTQKADRVFRDKQGNLHVHNEGKVKVYNPEYYDTDERVPKVGEKTKKRPVKSESPKVEEKGSDKPKRIPKKDDPDYVHDGVRYRTKRDARLAAKNWDRKKFEEVMKGNTDRVKIKTYDYSGDADSWSSSSNAREYEVDGAYVDKDKRVHLYEGGKWRTLPKNEEIDDYGDAAIHTNWGGEPDKKGAVSVGRVGEYLMPKSMRKKLKQQKALEKNAEESKEEDRIAHPWAPVKRSVTDAEDREGEKYREKARKGELSAQEMLDPEVRRKMFGKTADMMRGLGDMNLRNSMREKTEEGIDKAMDASNKFEDAARQFEGKRPIISLAREKIGEAHIHADEVTKDLQDSLEGDSGSVDRGLPFRVKGEKSMHRKIREKAWKKQLQPEEYAARVTDALRFTDMVEGKDFVRSFDKMREGLAERGYDMVEVENTIHKRGENYRGVNTLVTSPKGYTFELQFHTPQSFDIKEENHKDYNVERRASTPPSVSKALQQQMRQRSRAVKTPKGASKIQDVKRRPSTGPSEDAIRGMMKRKGVDRITAIKYLKAMNK